MMLALMKLYWLFKFIFKFGPRKGYATWQKTNQAFDEQEAAAQELLAEHTTIVDLMRKDGLL